MERLLVRVVDGKRQWQRGVVYVPGDSHCDSLLPLKAWLELEKHLDLSKPVLVVDGEKIGLETGVKIVVERLSERRRLFVFGAGHVGRNVAMMGALLGLDVLLLDDRAEFLETFDGVDSRITTHLVNFEELHRVLASGRDVAIVIVTRGHQSDEIILKQVSEFDVGYVGMIGSRRRVVNVFRRLREVGVHEAFLSSVKAPIGLDIGAKTPQEIAVAVHGEIIRHFSERALDAKL